MCDLLTGLTIASTAIQMGSQYAQGRAQQDAYREQAKIAGWNQTAEEKKAEKVAENYAEKQHQLNQKHKLAVSNARAQAGASGIDAYGSVSDAIVASDEAFARDTKNLLSSQREDEWASYVKQINYLNEQNAYNQMAKNTGKQMWWGLAGTALSGASSIYGQQHSKAATQTSTASPYIQNNYNSTRTASLANQGYSYSGIPIRQGYSNVNWGMR